MKPVFYRTVEVVGEWRGKQLVMEGLDSYSTREAAEAAASKLPRARVQGYARGHLGRTFPVEG